MNKLKEVSINEIKKIIPNSDFINITKGGNSLFALNDNEPMEKREIDSLINIEIALRRCKRVGIFK